MVTKNKKSLHLATQERLLKKYFPGGICSSPKPTTLIWEGYLKPTAFSREYKIRMEYEITGTPNVYVIEPKKLALPSGKIALEHVYDQIKQKLCLFYPNNKEWKNNMVIATTIIFWTCEWLYFYEIWLETSEWKGGGHHPESNNIK